MREFTEHVTHQEPVVFEYVHFAHRASPVLQQPRVYAALVELVSARKYADGLGRPVRFDAHGATVAVADDLLQKIDRKSFFFFCSRRNRRIRLR